MTRFSVYFLCVCIFYLLNGCAPKVTSTKSSQAYNEDLSGYRIKYKEEIEERKPGEKPKDKPAEGIKPESDVTARVDVLLDSINSRSAHSKYVNGYTIQVYSGNSREEAANIRSEIIKIVPESRPELSYVQPVYKVRVGQFLTRVEAQKLYVTLKAQFPNTLVLPERFLLNP